MGLVKLTVLDLRNLVTVRHRFVTARFWVEKVRKSGPVPEFRSRRVFRAGTKDPRTRCWLGYLSSPFSLLLFFLFFFFFWRGRRVLVFNPGSFINLFGPPICLYYACIF